ncbi:sigma-70 family RNA polymerase sigma factor [Pedosphaera parvula]|uniref:RNA polymerase, sigma-24 subunit, ECF subfamily n=1 Tax=Pedosphaera parvula (strain Ellin514) TaxID=320771 RepID=B9XBJ5_PEDPL|nr:sigma-70 family RNA polymerase sigma factor [Pedosphaera parvula]EEF62880.1 RNA polymerase, sigma-24 subunit, ECF subfamily [Pedosphaera parvula Ellin514]
MNSLTDQQLLRDYAGSRSEAAFAELVRRHIDFVYSAALRMVRDRHLAEDITQGAFVALAQNAEQLTKHPVLAGWLHRTSQNLAANAVRAEVRRRAREEKSAAMNEQLSNETDATWESVAPHLDAALGELSETDRDILLFRYFQGKSAREIAQTLGLTDEAAQKRVNRAVERLREIFAKRGVTVGAGSLLVLISGNAVQAAPTGLFTIISTSAAMAGTAAISTATKTIAMTTLQKSLLTATLIATVSTSIYQTKQASTLRAQMQNLQQQLQPLTDQNRQLTLDREKGTRQLSALRAEIGRLNSNQSELLRLRSETGRLRHQTNELGKLVRTWSAASTPDQSSESTNFPKDSWAFVGFGTPEATIQSFMWAKSRGDVKTAFDAATPELKRKIMDLYFKDKTDAEISDLLVDSSKNQNGVRVLKRMNVADDQVIFQVHFDGYPEKSFDILSLKKIDDEWKVSNTEDHVEQK